MGSKLFVGNLAWKTTNEELEEAFSEYGSVESATVITKREPPHDSRGFAFVKMSSDDEADNAISGLDGKDLNGRPLRVSEARERERR